MGTYKTRIFGELTIDETSDYEYFDLYYKEKPMYISLSGFSDQKEKILQCLKIIDRYDEIHEMSKSAIAENFAADEVIQYYFKFHFETLEKETIQELFGVSEFDNFSIEKAAEKMEYPDLVFSLEYEEISLSVDYRVSKEYSDEVLSIKMDENLTILEFSREN